jgi:hypothetical protein
MITYKNIVQGTEEWDKIRYGKVGGTRSKGLFKDSETLLVELIADHSEEFEPDYDTFETPAMLRGHELEPRAREELASYTGISFEEVGWLQCEENSLIGISPDGISTCGKYACELKCLGEKRHIEVILSEEILPDYTHQIIHYFTVIPTLEKLFWAAYRPENKYRQLVVKELTLESMVNIGTVKTPKIYTIAKCVETAKISAQIIKNELEANINSMKF